MGAEELGVGESGTWGHLGQIFDCGCRPFPKLQTRGGFLSRIVPRPSEKGLVLGWLTLDAGQRRAARRQPACTE